MIHYYFSLLLAYILGGFTFIPLIILLSYFLHPKKQVASVKSSDALEIEKKEVSSSSFYKVGWLQVTRAQKPLNKNNSLGNMVKSYLSGGVNHVNPQIGEEDNDNATYFAVLKFNTLYLYDSELQLDCKTIIDISHYTIRIYPYNLKDHELFSKVNRIQLKKKKQVLDEKDYYLNTNRCVDKEDWYVALKRASKLDSLPSWQQGDPTSYKELFSNSTHFDQDTMNHLISTIHSDPNHFESQWLNALLGRIFLGIYKTKSTKSFFYNKILSKIAKLNARRPPFLEEITVRSVDGGHGPPYITQPRLVHLSPQGEYTGDAQLYYDGHFRVELETVLTWKYSDRLPPIRIDLVLAITLKSIEGKIMFKIKEPPTNRAWIGFYKKPKMEWIVEPLVWEKRIGYSMVSKAIQTKIEEIIAETMVLPNMDDMVFFQTEGVGGIYGEEDNYGKVDMTAFDLDTKRKKNIEKKPLDSNASSASYQSLPELYSSPSELVLTADPFPLLSTSVSSNVMTPVKKRWFKKKQATTDTHSEFNASTPYDTPSQQTLKSVITPTINRDVNNQKTRLKRNKSATYSIHPTRSQQYLATNVDHSVQSLILNTKSISSVETPTLDSLTAPKNSTIGVALKNDATTQGALHSVRLSKKMLLLADQPSRLRSKSLPSAGLSMDVAQMENSNKKD